MDFKCRSCQTEWGSAAALHRHIKKEHLLMPKDYYPFFFDRRDKFDDELIEFKDIKSYFSTDFNSKYNLLKWVATEGKNAQAYVLDLLKKRAEEKETNIIPSHVELRSLFAPSLSDYITCFGGLENFKKSLEEAGLKMKLDLEKPDIKQGDLKIFIDTREQMPLKFEGAQVRKLIVGDYCPNEEFFCNLFIERKSMFDLAGTLTKGLERFEKEIIRAKELGAYLVVITESSFTDALEYSPRNSFSQKIGGAYLFNKIRMLMTKYDNIQFLFSSTRARSAELMDKIFRIGEQAKTLDLEYLKDRREI